MLRSRLLFASLALAAASALSIAAVGSAALFGQDMMPKPTTQHEMLQKSVGSYEGTVTMHLEIPGVPTDPIPATDTITAFGKFWTVSRFESTFMGIPFSGTGQMGYDPGKKKYIGTWIDSMAPTLSVMEGDYDEQGGTLIMHYEAPDMVGKMTPHRNELTCTEDGYTLEFYMGEGDAAVHSMTIAMTRTGDGGK